MRAAAEQRFAVQLAEAAQGWAALAGAFGRAAAGSAVELELRVAGGSSPAFAVEAEDLVLRARGEPARRLGAARLSLARISDRARPRRFPDLRLEGELEPREGALAFRARLRDAAERLVVDVEGRHEPVSGSGGASVRLRPLVFGDGGLRPAQLSPAAGELVRSARGRVEARAALRWQSAAPLAGSAELALRDLDLETQSASFERLNAVVQLDRLFPPATPRGQLVSMARFDLGLPLLDGLVAFQLLPSGRLRLESAHWRLAGGSIRSDPGVFDPRAAEQTLVLRVEEVDLGQLLAQASLGGLSGEGVVAGTLPVVRSRAGSYSVRDGLLAAQGRGIVRYDSGDLSASAPGSEILLEALKNFHYDRLALALDGSLDGAVALRVDLEGANPDYREGQPIQLHVNVEAELGDLLRARDLSYRVPETIEERLRRFGSGGP